MRNHQVLPRMKDIVWLLLFAKNKEQGGEGHRCYCCRWNQFYWITMTMDEGNPVEFILASEKHEIMKR